MVKKQTEEAPQKLRYTCSEGCGKKDMTKDELIAHLKDECPKVKLPCKLCEIEFERADFAEHNCRKALKSKIEDVKKEIETQKKKFESELNEKKQLTD